MWGDSNNIMNDLLETIQKAPQGMNQDIINFILNTLQPAVRQIPGVQQTSDFMQSPTGSMMQMLPMFGGMGGGASMVNAPSPFLKTLLETGRAPEQKQSIFSAIDKTLPLMKSEEGKKKILELLQQLLRFQ